MNCLGTDPNFPIFICYSELHAKQSQHIIPALQRVCKQFPGSTHCEDPSCFEGAWGLLRPPSLPDWAGVICGTPFPTARSPERSPLPGGMEGGKAKSAGAAIPLLRGVTGAIFSAIYCLPKTHPLEQPFTKTAINIFITKYSLPSTTAKPAHIFHRL